MDGLRYIILILLHQKELAVRNIVRGILISLTRSIQLLDIGCRFPDCLSGLIRQPLNGLDIRQIGSDNTVFCLFFLDLFGQGNDLLAGIQNVVFQLLGIIPVVDGLDLLIYLGKSLIDLLFFFSFLSKK